MVIFLMQTLATSLFTSISTEVGPLRVTSFTPLITKEVGEFSDKAETLDLRLFNVCIPVIRGAIATAYTSFGPVVQDKDSVLASSLASDSRTPSFLKTNTCRLFTVASPATSVTFVPEDNGTDIGNALRYLTGAIKKKCTAFLLSDMLDVDQAGNPLYEDALKIAVNRHDLSVIRVYDPRERTLPPVGLVHVKDAETG